MSKKPAPKEKETQAPSARRQNAFTRNLKKAAIIPLAALTFFLHAKDASSEEQKKPTSEYQNKNAQEKKQIIDSIWNEIQLNFPKTMKCWQDGRMMDELNSGIEVEILPHSAFSFIEDEGKSAKIDDFFRFYLNMDRPLIKAEACEKISGPMLYYGGFYSKTPFGDYEAKGLMPTLFSTLLSGKDSAIEKTQANKEQECFFFFAAFLGPREFVEAYSSHDTGTLQIEFDNAFGTGSYANLLYSKNPMHDIRDMLEGKGMLEGIYSKMQKIAFQCGYKIGKTTG
ncbi:hypothetical protein COU37_03790 [Candidatus Micrarchaeota archaeon CG10_big_fil_rev_8_21_14_0_10_45_29]|nr:MAG: hypothetical protein COU37_03790 [Candidatus Micrarchaeota archaeon CG10_big_fil_rev_8_21_14_0_10_45_29]